MSVFAVSPSPKTHHQRLPAYAGFLLENSLDDFALKQLNLCFTLEIPFIHNFAFLEEQKLVSMFRTSSMEALTMLSQERHDEQIEHSLQRWLQIHPELQQGSPEVGQYISTLCFVQKQAFLDFIPTYTQDPRDIIDLVREIDLQFFNLESAAITNVSQYVRNIQGHHVLITDKIVPAMVFTYDLLNHRLRYFNEKVSDFLGYSSENLREATSDIIVNTIHPDDLALIADQGYQLIQNSDDVKAVECRVKDKNGNFRLLEVYVTASERNEAGQVVTISGAALDVTSQRETENALRQKTFMLDQSNANLEEFAYIASHDLKEPLRKISAFGDRLLERQRDLLTDEGKIYLDKMLSACQRMQGMIGDLLSISRVSGNKTFSSCDLNTVLQEVIQSLSVTIERKRAIIHAESLPQLNVVSMQITQLFQHILNNALKFCKQDVAPHIRITTRQLSQTESERFKLCPSRQYLCIDFADNGIGFDNQFSEKIFAIFQRLHGKNEFEGSGIGLTICKKIMDNHGGAIYASGKPGEGSIFSTIFPI